MSRLNKKSAVLPSCMLMAILAGVPIHSQASYAFVDGSHLVNYTSVYHENDSDWDGNPVHVYIPDTALGAGSVIESAAAVLGGTADDGTIVPSMTLKAYSSLGSMTTTDTVSMRSQARFDADFEVTAAGTQSISVAWSGMLQSAGDAYAWYNLKVGFNPWSGVYDLMNISEDTLADDTVFVNDVTTFTFDFDPADVGSTQYLQVFLTTYAEMPYGGGSTTGAYADLSNTFRVTGWSSGLESLDGATPAIPIPPAVWLFGSGLLGLVGVARRKSR
jgi:hypothetical protein